MSGNPGLHPPAHFTSRHVDATGVRLHYLDYGTEGLPPILCVHGGGAHAHWFDWMARGFTRDHHVRALDLRGHGDSGWCEAGDYTPARFAADVGEVAERLDLRNFVLIGHSMGGMVSLVHAATRPKRLGCLVVVDTSMEISEERMATIRKIGNNSARGYESREALMARYRLLPSGSVASADVLQHIAYHSGRLAEDGKWHYKFDRKVYQRRERVDCYEQFAKVEVPTLLVKGALSGRITDAIEAKVRARCPHVEIAEVADSYHHVTLDNPQGLEEVVRRFLRAHA